MGVVEVLDPVAPAHWAFGQLASIVGASAS
jgi:hypothetical protein